MPARIAATFLAILLAFSASAGVHYRFRTEFVARGQSSATNGEVWSDGRAYRYELREPGTPHIAVVSTDGDRTVSVMNLDARSYHRRARATNALSSRLFAIPFRTSIIGCPVVTSSQEPGEPLKGWSTVKHTVHVSYSMMADANGSLFDAVIDVHAVIWEAPDLPPTAIARSVRTGVADVDSAINSALDEIGGMVVRHELEVTRRYAQGMDDRESTRTVITSLDVIPLDRVIFEVPPDFTIEPDPAEREKQRKEGARR